VDLDHRQPGLNETLLRSFIENRPKATLTVPGGQGRLTRGTEPMAVGMHRTFAAAQIATRASVRRLRVGATRIILIPTVNVLTTDGPRKPHTQNTPLPQHTRGGPGGARAPTPVPGVHALGKLNAQPHPPCMGGHWSHEPRSTVGYNTCVRHLEIGIVTPVPL
jgi:hypothetical protein